MGWPTTNWNNADWSALSTVNAFIEAINERLKAVSKVPTLLSLVEIGTDVQSAEFWRTIQEWTMGLACFFVESGYTGGSSRPPSITFERAFQLAGLTYSNWRRYTTHPDEGGMPQYGVMQPGDIIGPWIFEDIQKFLNVLTRTWHEEAGGSRVIASGRTRKMGTNVPRNSNWADFKVGAEAAYASWAASPVTAEWLSSGVWAIPGFKLDALHVCWGDSALTFDGWPDHVSGSVDFFYMGINGEGSFCTYDDQGFGLTEDTYLLKASKTFAAASADVNAGVTIGDGSFPNWCSMPTTLTGLWQGFHCLVGIVTTWNFTYHA